MKHVLAVVLLALCGCTATPSVARKSSAELRPSHEQEVSLYEAALRSRFAKAPLRRHEECRVFINSDSLPTELAGRFKGHRLILASGSPGPLAPSARWYFLWVGGFTPERALVVVQDAREMLILEFTHTGSAWTLVGERPTIIT